MTACVSIKDIRTAAAAAKKKKASDRLAMSDLLKLKPSNKASIVSSLDAYHSTTGPYSNRGGEIGGPQGGVPDGNAGTGASFFFSFPPLFHLFCLSLFSSSLQTSSWEGSTEHDQKRKELVVNSNTDILMFHRL